MHGQTHIKFTFMYVGQHNLSFSVNNLRTQHLTLNLNEYTSFLSMSAVNNIKQKDQHW